MYLLIVIQEFGVAAVVYGFCTLSTAVDLLREIIALPVHIIRLVCGVDTFGLAYEHVLTRIALGLFDSISGFHVPCSLHSSRIVPRYRVARCLRMY